MVDGAMVVVGVDHAMEDTEVTEVNKVLKYLLSKKKKRKF
jgi:hypothetical protein